MSELLSQLQQLGDGEIDDLSIAHDASEEIVALRLRLADLVEALERIASWPNGGNRSGQTNIQMFAAKTLAAYRKGVES